MSNRINDINIKNHTYYFCYEMINLKNFDLNSIKIGENSRKNIVIYYIGYVKIKDLIRSIIKNSVDCDKIKFNSDVRVPLNKTTEIPSMIIVVRTTFHENNN